jgi:riboflavin biosynthesis pyrimidine reductase
VSRLTRLELLFDGSRGHLLPLPRPLASVYGPLRLPPGRPMVIGNFATTLDGVVSLQLPGRSGGGEITGSDPHDRFLMGLLRAAADAVIVGAGTLRAVPHHRWTPQYIYPAMTAEFAELRSRLGRSPTPLNVIVTATGKVDLSLPVFASGEVPTLIITTAIGARRLTPAGTLPGVKVVAVRRAGSIPATAILRAVRAAGARELVLVEGGPHLIGDFFAENWLGELFLTLAPQIAGRDGGVARPGLVAGRNFAPDHPLWGSLVGARRAGNLLFLRFSFQSPVRVPTPRAG